MNWDKEIEVEGKEGGKAVATLGDIQNSLMEELTREKAEEFAAELIKWAEIENPALCFFE